MYTQRTQHPRLLLPNFSQHGNMRAVSQDMGNKVTGITYLNKYQIFPSKLKSNVSINKLFYLARVHLIDQKWQ